MEALEPNATLKLAFDGCEVDRVARGPVIAYTNITLHRCVLTKYGVNYRTEEFKATLKKLILAYGTRAESKVVYETVKSIEGKQRCKRFKQSPLV